MFHADDINSPKKFKRILRKIEWDSVDKLVWDTRVNFRASCSLRIQSKFWKFLQNLMPLHTSVKKLVCANNEYLENVKIIFCFPLWAKNKTQEN